MQLLNLSDFIKGENQRQCQCGVQREARIVGGVVVPEKDQYPWMVGLSRKVQHPDSNLDSLDILSSLWALGFSKY